MVASALPAVRLASLCHPRPRGDCSTHLDGPVLTIANKKLRNYSVSSSAFFRLIDQTYCVEQPLDGRPERTRTDGSSKCLSDDQMLIEKERQRFRRNPEYVAEALGSAPLGHDRGKFNGLGLPEVLNFFGFGLLGRVRYKKELHLRGAFPAADDPSKLRHLRDTRRTAHRPQIDDVHLSRRSAQRLPRLGCRVPAQHAREIELLME